MSKVKTCPLQHSLSPKGLFSPSQASPVTWIPPFISLSLFTPHPRASRSELQSKNIFQWDMAEQCANVATLAGGGWGVGRPMNRERGAKEEATSPQSPPGASTSSQHDPQEEAMRRHSKPRRREIRKLCHFDSKQREAPCCGEGTCTTSRPDCKKNNNTNLRIVPKVEDFLAARGIQHKQPLTRGEHRENRPAPLSFAFLFEHLDNLWLRKTIFPAGNWWINHVFFQTEAQSSSSLASSGVGEWGGGVGEQALNLRLVMHTKS